MIATHFGTFLRTNFTKWSSLELFWSQFFYHVCVAHFLFENQFLDAISQEIRCYACTTIDANAMLSEISDPNWLRWLENVRYVPYSQRCIDYFEVLEHLSLLLHLPF